MVRPLIAAAGLVSLVRPLRPVWRSRRRPRRRVELLSSRPCAGMAFGTQIIPAPNDDQANDSLLPRGWDGLSEPGVPSLWHTTRNVDHSRRQHYAVLLPSSGTGSNPRSAGSGPDRNADPAPFAQRARSSPIGQDYARSTAASDPTRNRPATGRQDRTGRCPHGTGRPRNDRRNAAARSNRSSA